nr:hypothetical protein [Haloterrigena gelatinilytica]
MKKERDEEASATEYGTVLGVDLNVDGYLAVTSTGAFLGNADYLNHKRASTNGVAGACSRQVLGAPT